METASDLYREYERKYNNAYYNKKTLERKEEEYTSSKTRAETDLRASRKEKLNLEKRLEGVRRIIEMMEGTGGLLSRNVPDKIQRSNKSSDESGVDYRKCINCTGIASADIAQKFHSDKVYENPYSSNALTAFKAEEQRLINAIAEIERQISLLDSKIETLKKQIKSCNNEIYNLKKDANYYYNEMCYYRGRI